MPNQTILDALPYGVIITDKLLRVTTINRWVADFRNLTLADCAGRLFAEVFPEVAERGLLSVYDFALETQQQFTLSTRLHKYFLAIPAQPDSGLEFMPQSTLVAPLNVAGELVGTITIISDVSDRVVTEHALNHEVEKLSILHQLDQALTTLELPSLFNLLTEQIGTIFSAKGVAVFLDQDQTINLVAGNGIGALQGLVPGSLAEWCFQRRQARYFNFRHSQEKFHPLVADAKAELAAPMLLGSICIGVISASFTQNDQVDPYDLELLQALAARAAAAIYNARLHDESQFWRNYYQQVNSRMQTLLNATRLISSKLELQDLMDSTAILVKDVFQADLAVFYRLDAETGHFVPVSSAGNKEDLNAIPRIQPQVNFDELKNQVIIGGCHEIAEKRLFSTEACQWLKSKELNSLMASTLTLQNKLAGFMMVFSKKQHGYFGGEEVELLNAIGVQLNMALENAELFAAQQKLAVTDGLTGISNRRRFDQELANLVWQANRSQQPVSLIMIDIDNFKRFNDTYGHQAGDEVLRLLAQVIQKTVRGQDIVARYGGEEIAVILPSTGIHEAVLVAERIRKAAMRVTEIAQDNSFADEKVTISLGVASAPLHAADALELVAKADEFLYQAKHSGKNRVVTCLPEMAG